MTESAPNTAPAASERGEIVSSPSDAGTIKDKSESAVLVKKDDKKPLTLEAFGKSLTSLVAKIQGKKTLPPPKEGEKIKVVIDKSHVIDLLNDAEWKAVKRQQELDYPDKIAFYGRPIVFAYFDYKTPISRKQKRAFYQVRAYIRIKKS
jgi:hypothetical protein